jgi:hypothetical protein
LDIPGREVETTKHTTGEEKKWPIHHIRREKPPTAIHIHVRRRGEKPHLTEVEEWRYSVQDFDWTSTEAKECPYLDKPVEMSQNSVMSILCLSEIGNPLLNVVKTLVLTLASL